MYEIKHSDIFAKQIRKLKDKAAISRLLKGIQELETDPHKGEALHYELEGFRSLRVGAWRVAYQVNENEHNVTIVAMGHGHDVYEDLKRYILATRKSSTTKTEA